MAGDRPGFRAAIARSDRLAQALRPAEDLDSTTSWDRDAS